MQRQLVAELEKLQHLHTSGFLTDTELAQAKAKLLNSPASEAVTVEEADAMLARVDRAETQARSADQKAHVLELQRKQELLEAGWAQERKAYLINSNSVSASEPSAEAGLLSGVVSAAIGVAMILYNPEFLVLPGLLIIAAGARSFFVNYGQAKALEQATRSYEEQRDTLYKEIARAQQR